MTTKEPPDLRTYSKEDSIQVFGLFGHACLFHDSSDIIEVPPGIIWIENSACGLPSLGGSDASYQTKEMQEFLTTTKMPQNPSEKSAYNAKLDSLTNFSIRAHFPGDEIGNGINDLFLKFSGNLTHSGIIPLYGDKTITKDTIAESRDVTALLKKEDIDWAYNYSIFPTKEEANDIISENKTIELNYKDFFQIHMRPLSSPKRSHIVIIQSGCRGDCKSGNTKKQSSLRQYSARRISENMRHRELDQLLVRKIDGTTKLMELVEAGYYNQAIEFCTLLKTHISRSEFTEYLNIISYEGRTVLNYTEDSYLQKYFILNGAHQVSVEEMIITLTGYLNINKITTSMSIIFTTLSRLASTPEGEVALTSNMESITSFIKHLGNSATALVDRQNISIVLNKMLILSQVFLDIFSTNKDIIGLFLQTLKDTDLIIRENMSKILYTIVLFRKKIGLENILSQRGAIQSLLQVLQDPASNNKICKEISTLFTFFSTSEDGIITILKEADIITFFIQILTDSLFDLDSQELISITLNNIAIFSNYGCEQLINREGRIDSFFEILYNPEIDEKIRSNIRRMLITIVRSENCRAIIVTQPASIRSLLKILVNSAENIEFCQEISSALLAISNLPGGIIVRDQLVYVLLEYPENENLLQFRSTLTRRPVWGLGLRNLVDKVPVIGKSVSNTYNWVFSKSGGTRKRNFHSKTKIGFKRNYKNTKKKFKKY
jgi:hypothetical protein